MKQKSRIAALMLCVLLCFTMLFSVMFVAAESSHDCTGERCHVCVELRACLSLIKSVSLTASALIVFLFAGYFIQLVFRRAVLDTAGLTLVSLKVKLSN